MTNEAQEELEYYEAVERQKHLYGQKAQNYSDIDDSFKFKNQLISTADELKNLMSKEIKVANFSSQDKKRAYDYLRLALDLSELGLKGEIFYKDVVILSGVSQGYKGFQQEKFNEQRDIRVSNVENKRDRKRFWRN